MHPDWLVRNAALQAGRRLLREAKTPAASRPPGKSGRKRQDAQRAIKNLPTRTTTFRSGSEVRIESALHSALLAFLWSYPPLNGGYSKPFPATPKFETSLSGPYNNEQRAGARCAQFRLRVLQPTWGILTNGVLTGLATVGDVRFSRKVRMLRESHRITQMRETVSVGASLDFQLAGPTFKCLQLIRVAVYRMRRPSDYIHCPCTGRARRPFMCTKPDLRKHEI
jgi:hypothetical protein